MTCQTVPPRHGTVSRQVSVPQQFVDAGLGAGLGVDGLDDDGAGEAWAAILVGQRARNNHGIRRHLAIGDLAGMAVHNLRRLGDEHAHRDDRAFSDDHTLDHFGPRADEAIVFDDGRVRLQRLKNAANAGAGRDVPSPT